MTFAAPLALGLGRTGNLLSHGGGHLDVFDLDDRDLAPRARIEITVPHRMRYTLRGDTELVALTVSSVRSPVFFLVATTSRLSEATGRREPARSLLTGHHR